MTVDNLAGVAELVRDILDGSDRDNGTVLLATGGALWVTNVIAFSLWYWLLDRGGPAARALGETGPPAFAFPENVPSPELAPANWWPQYPGLPLSRASPTRPPSAPPTRCRSARWAKMVMLVQSSVSLVIAIMIVARAVNILT